MDDSNRRAKRLLEAEIEVIAERLQTEARVLSASLAGGDFLDLAQGQPGDVMRSHGACLPHLSEV